MKKITFNIKKTTVVFSTFVIFVFPVSTGYQLKSYEFGGGGGVGQSSGGNYSAEQTVGQVGASQLTGTTYNANNGLVFVQQANTPIAPTFNNTGNWYNKLFYTINTSNNPTDATYLIAITDDNWVTTHYVDPSTNTIGGTTYGISDFQTYASWGGVSGGYIIGLLPATTYKIKVKARQGVYTEGPFGPEATAATAAVTLTTDIDISPTDSETAAPYLVNIGSLTGGNITTATDKVWIDFDTNAVNGGEVFIYGQNTGLLSAVTGYTIVSATADLSVAAEGFGLIGSSVTQTSGGPFSFQSPYNGVSENVGIVNSTIRSILSSSNPIVAGRASFLVKAKPTTTTPAANDYTDLFTVIAAGSF